MTMSNRICLMNAGSIAQLGTPAELYQTPATAYVAGFLGASNLIAGTVSGSDTVRLHGGPEVRVRPRALAGRTGEVAVKVVRPGIAGRIERDLASFRWIAGMLGRSRFGRDLPVVETFDMIASMLLAQTDMLAESRNLAVFRAMLPAHGRIVIPEPQVAFTTPDVLVMDFVQDAVQLIDPGVGEGMKL